jgi:hypothetical protein
MGRRKVQKKRQARRRLTRTQIPGVPPGENAIWPEQYRGKRWKPIYGLLFAGKCQLCAYSCPLPKSRQVMDKWHGQTRLLLCTNHPAGPGELREVLPIETCRNFKAKSWQPARSKPAQRQPVVTADECDPTVRRIPLGHGLFATVDASDYEMLSKYKWSVFHYAGRVYAVCHTKGKTVYMHRMLMRPRKGYVVDHIDGNGLNNRRCNLRVCTPRQNRANARPRAGTSRFVGVYRKRGKWVGGITSRGKYYYVGQFDDEVEAAKARDRKAYELHGEYAYLNFPEDFRG